MRVLAVWQALQRGVTGDARKHELARKAEQLGDDPGEVGLRTMLQHVGADYAVEPALRRPGKRLVGRIEADDALDAPVFLHALPARDALFGKLERPILAAFAAAVVENRARAGLRHQPAHVVRLEQQAAAGKRVLGSDAPHQLAARVHLAVELEQAPVTSARILAAVRGGNPAHEAQFY